MPVSTVIGRERELPEVTCLLGGTVADAARSDGSAEVFALGGGLLPRAGITTVALSLRTDPPGRAARRPHPPRPRGYCRVRPPGLTRSESPHHGCQDGRRPARTQMHP